MKTVRNTISNNLVRLFFLCLVLGFVFVILNGVAKLYLAFFIAFLISFLLSPIVNFIESFGLPRILGVLIIAGTLAFIGFVFFEYVAPTLQSEITHLFSEKESIRIENRLQETTLLFQKKTMGIFPNQVSKNINYAIIKKKAFLIGKSLLPQDMSILGDLLTFILISPVITIVLLLQGDSIYKKIMVMIPNQYFEMVILLTDRIKNQIRRYLKGLSLQWLIFSSVLAVSLWMAGLPFAIPLGLFAATFNIIPYVGPILGIIPIIFMALLSPVDMNMSQIFLAIAVTQLVDNAFTQPVILAGSVQLHPLIAILTLITLQQYFGIIGMVVAIPLASIVMAFIEIVYKQMKAFGVI